MKVHEFVVKDILVKPEEMLEFDGMNMKILRKIQNWPNISETSKAIHFS